MLHSIIKLIRNRWPEMALVIAFQSFAVFLLESIKGSLKIPENAQPGEITSNFSDTTIFLYSMVAMVFMVLWLTLYLGFLASVSVQSNAPQQPVNLIRFGRRFFWRTIRFQLLFMFYTVIVYFISFELMRALLFKDVSRGSEPLWAMVICQFIPVLLLIKLLFVPAIMITRDFMLLPAMAFIRQIRLFNAVPFIVVVVVGVILDSGLLVAIEKVENGTGVYSSVLVLRSVLNGIVTLLIGLGAIWFICGKKFGDYQPEELESESEE